MKKKSLNEENEKVEITKKAAKTNEIFFEKKTLIWKILQFFSFIAKFW